jgi:hypothetical protein
MSALDQLNQRRLINHVQRQISDYLMESLLDAPKNTVVTQELMRHQVTQLVESFAERRVIDSVSPVRTGLVVGYIMRSNGRACLRVRDDERTIREIPVVHKRVGPHRSRRVARKYLKSRIGQLDVQFDVQYHAPVNHICLNFEVVPYAEENCDG